MARSSSPDREEIKATVSRLELVLGTTPTHVKIAWGATRCKFSDSFDKRGVLGCGRDAMTRALAPALVQDCGDVVFLAYFVSRCVAGRASADDCQP